MPASFVHVSASFSYFLFELRAWLKEEWSDLVNSAVVLSLFALVHRLTEVVFLLLDIAFVCLLLFLAYCVYFAQKDPVSPQVEQVLPGKKDSVSVLLHSPVIVPVSPRPLSGFSTPLSFYRAPLLEPRLSARLKATSPGVFDALEELSTIPGSSSVSPPPLSLLPPPSFSQSSLPVPVHTLSVAPALSALPSASDLSLDTQPATPPSFRKSFFGSVRDSVRRLPLPFTNRKKPNHQQITAAVAIFSCEASFPQEKRKARQVLELADQAVVQKLLARYNKLSQDSIRENIEVFNFQLVLRNF